MRAGIEAGSEALDVVIPVYNEGANIVEVLEGLRTAVKTPFRVLICYDFDEDTTLTALADYPHGRDVGLTLVKNDLGKGVFNAVMAGIQASTAPAILVFPADDTFNGGVLDSMVALFLEGCDIVAASRFIKGGCLEGAPWLKAVLTRTAAFTLYYLARMPTHDPTNGFKLYSRRVVETIHPETQEGWAFSLEYVVKAHRAGWRIGEVPASWYERTEGQSRFRVLKWLPHYLRWYAYAFATTYLFRRSL